MHIGRDEFDRGCLWKLTATVRNASGGKGHHPQKLPFLSHQSELSRWPVLAAGEICSGGRQR